MFYGIATVPGIDELLSEQRGHYYEAPGRSAIVHWRLVIAIGVVGLLLGVIFGIVRHPVYTATEELYVGKTLDIDNIAASAGLETAADEIAQDYSRLIATSTVHAAVEAALGHPSSIGSLSATEIPESPEITVIGTGTSAAAALRLTTAGSNALLATVASINSDTNTQLQGLLSTYKKLEMQIRNAQQQAASIQSSIAKLTTAGASQAVTAPLSTQLGVVEGDISGLELQANAVDAQYQSGYNPLQQEEQVLQQVAPAMSDGSNRKKVLELASFVGLVTGLFLGVAVASMTDIRTGRRVRARPLPE